MAYYDGYRDGNQEDELWIFLNNIYDKLASDDCLNNVPFKYRRCRQSSEECFVF